MVGWFGGWMVWLGSGVALGLRRRHILRGGL